MLLALAGVRNTASERDSRLLRGPHRFVQVVRTVKPMWTGGGQFAALVWGHQTAGSKRFIIGQKLSGLSGLWAGVRGLFGFNRNDSWIQQGEGNLSVSIACPDVPPGLYSYLVSVQYYKRYAVPPSSSASQKDKHETFVDQYVASGIEWTKPQPFDALPTFNPDAPEPTPTPFNL